MSTFINGLTIVCAIGGEIWESTSLLGVVESVSTVWRRMLGEPVLDSRCLIALEREHVREASAAVDDSLASLFWLRSCSKVLNNVGVVLNLCRAD